MKPHKFSSQLHTMNLISFIGAKQQQQHQQRTKKKIALDSLNACNTDVIHVRYTFFIRSLFFFVWLWVTWFIAAYMRRDYRVPKTCWLRLTGAVWSVHCMLFTNLYAWKEKKRRTESISLYYIVVIVVCAAGVKASTSATVPYSLQLCSL